MRGKNEVASKADVVPSGTESLLNGIEISGENFTVIRITEDDDRLDFLLNVGGELSCRQMDKLSSLTVLFRGVSSIFSRTIKDLEMYL